MCRNKRLWSSLLLVIMAIGLGGCAPRDVAVLAPEIVVRPGMYQPAVAQAKPLPADPVAALGAEVAELAEAIRLDQMFQAVPREDGQISFQFAHPGYVGTVSVTPMLEKRAEIAQTLEVALIDRQPSRLFGDVRNDIYPALISAEQRLALFSGGMDVLTAPLSGTLSIAFAVNNGGVQWLVDKELAKIWGLKAEELQAMAWQNMWGLTSEGPQFEGQGARKVIVYNLNDGYDASRAVLTPYLRYLGAQLQGRMVLALPSRDVLLVFGDADPAFVAEMKDTVMAMYREMEYGLSPGLFMMRGDDLTPYPVGLTQQPPVARQLWLGRVLTEDR